MAKKSLADGLQSYLSGMTEQQAIKLLEQEGRRLKYIAMRVWRQYLDSYQPKKYVRTGKTLRGIKLGKVERLDANHFGIRLEFENDLMYHDSVINKYEQPQGHSLMLISDGWNRQKKRTKLVERIGRQVYMFTYFEGADIIGKIEREYNKYKPLGITLEINWSGRYIRGRK